MVDSLIYILSLLEMKRGESRWIHAPLANSYEYQIIDGNGALSIPEYRQLFYTQGLKVEHLEIARDLKMFEDTISLKNWIRTEMAVQFGEEGNERFVEDYFDLMKAKGWMELNGKIGFPRRRLFVLLAKE